ncbi:MAG: hypothetical protein JAZ12_15400 [Candidatus Thiodiazotropha taylori]|nr:hypothetical protein [Candidatus Thiodiazotropha taylori]
MPLIDLFVQQILPGIVHTDMGLDISPVKGLFGLALPLILKLPGDEGPCMDLYAPLLLADLCVQLIRIGCL